MNSHKWFRPFLVAALVWCLGIPVPCPARDGFTIVDFMGRHVRIPAEINRVVTISDGMIEGVMTRLGEAGKIVALGSACLPKTWSYTYPGADGAAHEYREGMNPVTVLNPGFRDLPLVARFGTGIRYEVVAALSPDLIIVRAGACTLCQSRDILDKNISLLASLGIPLVVLQGPNQTDNPGIESISGEILLLGKIFQKEDQARDLAEFLEASVETIRERTAPVPPQDRKDLLMLGLSPKARHQGGAGHVKGEETLQSRFLDRFVNAGNAYQGPGAWNILNTEQLLALDPDLIVLVTAWGYHPPEELYEAPYYEGLREMRAVRDRAVAVLPWSPCNCEKRLEYPVDIMVMARAAYPERFRDIDLGRWLLDFYGAVYQVDENTAGRLMSAQWMDWALNESGEPGEPGEPDESCEPGEPGEPGETKKRETEE